MFYIETLQNLLLLTFYSRDVEQKCEYVVHFPRTKRVEKSFAAGLQPINVKHQRRSTHVNLFPPHTRSRCTRQMNGRGRVLERRSWNSWNGPAVYKTYIQRVYVNNLYQSACN